MTGKRGRIKVLLLEACRAPHVSSEELIRRSMLLHGLSLRNVIDRRTRAKGTEGEAGFSTVSMYGIPLGLAFVAGGVSREKFDVSHVPLILDAYRFELDRRRLMDRIRAIEPHVVGMTLNHTADREAALGMCADIKKISKDIVTILGGVEATFSGIEIMETESVDFIVKGEGDVRFGLLLENIFGDSPDPSTTGGLLFRRGGDICGTFDAVDHVDIENIRPAYDCLRLDDYIDAGVLAHVQTSRGCPYGCSFCSHTAFWGRKMRYRSPVSVVDEVAGLAGKGVRILYFCDSTFTMNRRHVKGILEEIRDRGFTPPVIAFETHVERVDRDMVRLLSQAGVGIVALGVESADEGVLARTGGKGRDGYVRRVFEIHDWLKEEGISMYASLVVGLPGESMRSFEATKKMVEGLHDEGLFWADAKLAMAFPGSDLRANPDKYGVELTGASPWLFYDRPGFVCSGGPSEEDILKMHRELVELNAQYVMKKDYVVARRKALEDKASKMDSLAGKKESLDWYD
ncbi:MAG: radical SAM protein [Pseudomonadota bacterium]